MRALLPRGAALLALALLLVAPAAGQDEAAAPPPQLSDKDCLDCHEGSGGDPVEVTPAHLAKSVHADFGCLDCHADIAELPHEEKLPAVNCGLCHDDVVSVYTRHGLGKVGVDDAVPSCSDCHGTHDIRSVAEKESPVNPLNLPKTCGKCHEDDAFTREQGIRFKHPVSVYSNSVHGRAAQGGIYAAATCNDCHSTEGSAHKILPPGDVNSAVNHFNIAKTCGRCHQYIAQDYHEGIHGQLTEHGQVESPVCTTCHGEHNILPTADPRSPVSANRLAEATCSPCHESAKLNDKYELPTGRLQSFQDSYHGLKSKAGDATVANCASCHGAHRILPAADSTSTIHPAKLQHTCGGCHPSITAEIAATPIHQSTTGLHTGIAGIVRRIYIVLIVVVIGGMALHWLIDLAHQIRKVMAKRQVRRMDGDEVVQHFVLALSFTVLVVSGFSLRFYEAWWARWLFSWEGGSGFRGDLHRVAGVVLLLASVWHLVFLMTRRGRVFIKEMWPSAQDLRDFFGMMAYNLGRSPKHPLFGRFSYVEKAEYWALVWGTIVMGATGLMLWFDNLFVNWLPKGFLDVMLIVHYYEAWLAFLAILIWHMYSTVFSPKVYPRNPAWLTGFMPEEQFKAEHPLALAASNAEEAAIIAEREAGERGPSI